MFWFSRAWLRLLDGFLENPAPQAKDSETQKLQRANEINSQLDAEKWQKIKAANFQCNLGDPMLASAWQRACAADESLKKEYNDIQGLNMRSRQRAFRAKWLEGQFRTHTVLGLNPP